MKRFLAVALGGILAFGAFQSELKADDNDFINNVKTFLNKAQDRVDSLIAQVKAYVNSPEVQARLEQVRAEHRAQLKEVLLAVYPKLKEYREQIRPMVEAQIKLKFMELHAKMVDALPFLKAQAAKAYEAELDKVISSLPEDVQNTIRTIRASSGYQAARAAALSKIETILVNAVHKSADVFIVKLNAFVDQELAKLDAKILAKIETL
jgi:hypothetical protein